MVVMTGNMLYTCFAGAIGPTRVFVCGAPAGPKTDNPRPNVVMELCGLWAPRLGGYTVGVKGAAPGTVPLDGGSRRPLEWTIDKCGVAGAVIPASNTRGGGIPGKYAIAGWGVSE